MTTAILTVLIGATLWPVHQGDPAVRLVGITLQLLAALTLPHMLLEAWLTRTDRFKSGLNLGQIGSLEADLLGE